MNKENNNNKDAKSVSSQLWDMANNLRGTMDASEYKNYILPFMFYRYLSEHQDEYIKNNSLEDFYTATGSEKEDYLEDIADGLGYVIEPKFTWNNLIEKIKNHKIIASDFQDMFDSFNENAKRNLESKGEFANVFSDVNLGDSRLGSGINERAKALYDIVLMINNFKFKDESGHDVLGDVYEYLIGEFAANAGKKGGEFYTPHEVSRVLTKIVGEGKDKTKDQFRVYDPTMGSGSLLLSVRKELPDGEVEGKVHFYGEELNTTTYNLARMNLMMHDVQYRNMTLKCADTLSEDWPFDKKDGIDVPTKFDAIVANPPYSQKWDTTTIDREKDVRFKSYGVAPSSKADYAFVLHGLHHLDEEGTMAIVLPHGVLFRGAAEGKIRKNIIDNNMLDAVIGLPANLFYGTSIPTCILVFKGREARKDRKDILFIDASREFDKSKNQNKLTEENIAKIMEAYKNRQDVDKYAHVATIEEIKNNDYNLNIPRYVDTFEEEEVESLTQIGKDLSQNKEQIKETTEKLVKMLNDLTSKDEEVVKEIKNFIDLIK